MRDKPLDAVGTTGGVGKIDTRMKSEPIPRTEASIQPIDDWVRKCEGLEKQLASAEDRAKRAKAGIFELLERYLDCVKDWHEYHHTSEFNDCQVEVCKNARVAVKDYEDAKGMK